MTHTQVSHKFTLKNLIDYKLRIITQDGKVYIGTLLAFDSHMNVVLSDCIEERLSQQHIKVLKQNQTHQPRSEKRTLGLTILRGEHILSTVVESAPTLSKKERLQAHSKVSKKLSSKKQSGNITVTASALENTVNQRTSRFTAPPGFKKR